jgi:hypothetical protein
MKFVIWSIAHHAWWKADWNGYTETLTDAGVYEPAEASRILEQANIVGVQEVMIPVDCFEGAAAIVGQWDV